MLQKIKLADGSVQNIKEIPMNIRAKYKETFEIDPMWILKAIVLRAKWIDQSASTNVFINTTSGKELSNVYMQAWEMGLKKQLTICVIKAPLRLLKWLMRLALLNLKVLRVLSQRAYQPRQPVHL